MPESKGFEVTKLFWSKYKTFVIVAGASAVGGAVLAFILA
jgi:hypothetical protein